MLPGVLDNRSNVLDTRKPRLALVSCGLGNVSRGFEISSARFFRALKSRPELDVELFSGGPYPDARQIWNIDRNAWLRAGVGALPGVNDTRWTISYVMEQITYAFGLIPLAGNPAPDVIWTKDVPMVHIFHEYRRLTNAHYKIIFANGAGFKPSTYARFDFIQHLHPDAYREAIDAGIPAGKMTVLPNLVPHLVPSAGREELRRQYGFNQDDWIVLSIAAWNKHHKRVDYMIEEVARINDPRVKLVLCGQPEPEADELKALGARLLGDRVQWLTVPEQAVADLLSLCDVFALASLYEGLGAVLIEAALSGIPVVTHQHPSGRYIFQDDYWLADLSMPGNLSARLNELRNQPPAQWRLEKLQQSVSDRFNEDKVAQDFVQMVEKVLSAPLELNPERRIVVKH